MLPKFFKILLATAAIYNYSTATQVQTNNNSDNKAKVLATYSQGEVRSSDIMKQFQNFFENDPNLKGKTFDELPFEMQSNLLKFYLNKNLIEAEVAKSKVRETSAFKAQLETIANQVAQREFIDGIVKERVTDEAVQKQVEKIKEELKNKEEVKIKHILLKTKKEADDVKKRILKGEKFDALAKKLSNDESSKAAGGELGYLTQEYLDPDLADKVFKMKKSEISSPLQSGFGWHIVQLIDKRKVEIPTEEQLKNIARSKLSQESIEKYVEELNNKANVKILLEAPKPIEESKQTETKQ